MVGLCVCISIIVNQLTKAENLQFTILKDFLVQDDASWVTTLRYPCNEIAGYLGSAKQGETMCHGLSTRLALAGSLKVVIWIFLRNAAFMKASFVVLVSDFAMNGLTIKEVGCLVPLLIFARVKALVDFGRSQQLYDEARDTPSGIHGFIMVVLFCALVVIIQKREHQRRVDFFSDFYSNIQQRRRLEREKVRMQRMKLQKQEYQNQILQHMNYGQWVRVERANSAGILDSSEAKAASSESMQRPEAAVVAEYQCWKIPFGDIAISQKRLGVGSFGMVHHGSYRGRDVAVKQMLEATPESIPLFVTELSILSQLTHPNIVKLIGAHWEAPGLYLALAYCARRDLETCLHAEKTLAWGVKARMLFDIACGMAYMHSKCICHRDLKPSNVLVHHNYSCCIGDFESSCNFGDETDDHTILVGTPIYIAPEMLEANENRNVSLPQSDVYSFGILCIAVAISPYLSLNQFMVRALGSTKTSVRKIDRVTDALSGGWRPDLTFGKTQDNKSFIRKWVKRQNPSALSSEQFSPEIICEKVAARLGGELAKIVKDCWIKEPGERASFTGITAGWRITAAASAAADDVEAADDDTTEKDSTAPAAAEE